MIRSLVLLAALALTSPAAELAIADATVTDFERGLILPHGHKFGLGDTVYVSFRVAGFTLQGEETGRLNLTWKVEALDSAGQPIQEPATGRIARPYPRELAPLPLVRAKFRLPDLMYPGPGLVKFSVTDKYTGHTATAELPFETRSNLPKLSGGFEIVGAGVFRSDADNEPLKTLVFRPGQAMWIRFLVAGYRVREGNEYDLSYGVIVKGANGRTILNIPEAAAESNPSFYRRAYVPALASVQLEPTIKPGTYTLLLTARDAVGKQEAKLELPFRIE